MSVEQTVDDAAETVEAEDLAGGDDGPAIIMPFNPALIKVDTVLMTIYQIVRKIKSEQIVLKPSFQRNFVWKIKQKTRLIESILLRIPLPAFYLSADSNEIWGVVDGLQRLSTLLDYLGGGFALSDDLEYLMPLEGKTFAQLPGIYQQRLEDTNLTLNVLRPEIPPVVKFTIFNRLNTGGLVLKAQEVRHAIYQGHATDWLAEMAALPAFLAATGGAFKPDRMDDQEAVLRFLAFRLYPYTSFARNPAKGDPANLDDLLIRTMTDLNQMSETGYIAEREAFERSMIKAEGLFGRYAFRRLDEPDGKRYPINKPLFEVWSVLLCNYTTPELLPRRDDIVYGFIDVIKGTRYQNDPTPPPDFNKAISLGTGSRVSITTRFGTIARLLQEVVGR